MLEDRLEKWANRYLMKFKEASAKPPLWDRVSIRCRAVAGGWLARSFVGKEQGPGGQAEPESAGCPGNKGCSHILVSISTSRASRSVPSIQLL